MAANVGVTPIGDRPGSTSTYGVTSWKGTAAGRARLIAGTLLVGMIFLHVTVAYRYQ